MTNIKNISQRFLDNISYTLGMKNNDQNNSYAASCYLKAKNSKGVNINELENEVIACNDLEIIYLFARDIKNASTDKLASSIITSENAEYIYKFAKDVPYADIYRLQIAIVRTNNLEYIYDFAQNVKGANKELLEQNILRSNNEKLIEKYIDNMEIKNPGFVEEYIINNHMINLIIKLAETGKFNNLRLESEIISSNDPRYIYEFAKIKTVTRIDKLEQAIINSNDPKYIYLFAKDIKNTNITALENKIIELAEPKFIYLLAEKEETDFNKLAQAIINTNNSKYIYKFANNYNDRLNSEQLEKFKIGIIKTKDFKLIKNFNQNISSIKTLIDQELVDAKRYLTTKSGDLDEKQFKNLMELIKYFTNLKDFLEKDNLLNKQDNVLKLNHEQKNYHE